MTQRAAGAMDRIYNFSAGPAMLPAPVLRQAAAEMLDWRDATGRASGIGVMEMSHRSREFTEICETALQRVRSLLNVPAAFKILFLQGGAIGQNAIVPMNLIARRPTLASDHLLSGQWSGKTFREAQRYGVAHAVAEAEDTPAGLCVPEPASWRFSPDPSYVHVCSNETIDGIELHTLPDLAALGLDAPLVVDCSSHIGSRPIDWSRVGLAYAGAQKNIGPAGLTLVFVREDLLGHALPICPTAFDYAVVAAHGSMYNTPPTYAIYIAGLVFEWMEQQGGVTVLEQRNIAKSTLLYDAIDRSGFYSNRVAPAFRSRMNVPFALPTPALDALFLEGAEARGLQQLKGHKSVGGLRASLYNAMPLAGVESLVAYMREFQALHG